MKRIVSNRRGQILVEYMLLLVVAATIAAIIVKGLANRDPNDRGFIVQRWLEVQQEIGGDLIDKCAGNDCNTP